MHSPELRFVPYRRRAFDYANFSCGDENLDEWLHLYAGQNQRMNRARTFLLINEAADASQVIGYFSLVNCQITPQDAGRILGNAYRYPMSATLLTRLAVDTRWQGQGIGGVLLVQAMRHVLAALEFSGSEVLLVDAVSEDAIRFYQRFGLELLRDDQRRLFIPTRKIAASIDAASR